MRLYGISYRAFLVAVRQCSPALAAPGGAGASPSRRASPAEGSPAHFCFCFCTCMSAINRPMAEHPMFEGVDALCCAGSEANLNSILRMVFR